MAKLNWQKANKQTQTYYQGTETALTPGQQKLQRMKFTAQLKALKRARKKARNISTQG